MKFKKMKFEFEPIAYVQTPFKDKFGIPRQPGLVKEAVGIIKFSPHPDIKTALKNLEEFSHLWVVFVFHEHGGKNWKPSIRPPRLGGARKVGVLSSRSPHRPNPIGLSAVSLLSVDLEAEGGPEVRVGGVDLLDGTPVLDVKPYIPYADSIADASAGWACEDIPRFPVHFDVGVEKQLIELQKTGLVTENFKKLIVQILELDPRPAFKKRQAPVGASEVVGSRYGFEVEGWDVKYQITLDGFLVCAIEPMEGHFKK